MKKTSIVVTDSKQKLTHEDRTGATLIIILQGTVATVIKNKVGPKDFQMDAEKVPGYITEFLKLRA